MNKRQYSLDFIKIIATIFILFHHYQQFISGSFEKGINFYGGIYNFGYMVELFFILSGYFMYPHIEKIRQGISFKDFFITRYIRLIPLVAIAAFAYQFLVLIHIKTVGTAWFMRPISIWETIVSALGFQEGWVFRNNIYVNYPVWYVSVLLLCYLIFFCTTFLSHKFHISGRYFYLIFIFVGIAINSYSWQFPFLNEYTARGYCAFFTGILLATYCFERNTTKRETIVSLGIVILIMDLIIFHNGFVADGIHYISTFILFPAFIIVFKNPIISKLFSNKIYQTAAQIAFNSFVWQMPLLVALLILINKVQIGVNFISRECMWGFLIVAAIVGAVSHFFIEKNVKNYIYKRIACHKCTNSK